MGTGASNQPRRGNNTIRQLAALHPLKQQPTEQPPHQARQPPLTTSQVQHERPPEKPKQNKTVWPLPSKERDEEFQINWPSNMERYSLKRAFDLQVSYHFMLLLF